MNSNQFLVIEGISLDNCRRLAFIFRHYSALASDHCQAEEPQKGIIVLVTDGKIILFSFDINL